MLYELIDTLLLAVNPISLFSVAFLESIFFPVPPDTILLPLVLLQPTQALLFAGICTLGSLLGAMVGYSIGVWGGQPLLRRYAQPQRIQKVHELFQKHEVWAIGIAGFTPIPYKVFAIGAGAFGINFRLFVLASLVSRGLRFFLASIFVALYGEPVLVFMANYFELLTIGLAISVISIYFLVRVFAKNKK